jgi:hypothetical protein
MKRFGVSKVQIGEDPSPCDVLGGEGVAISFDKTCYGSNGGIPVPLIAFLIVFSEKIDSRIW